MTRKKVTLAYITNDSERKASFKKRKKGLIKKVSELSTLCGVDACAIIYSPYEAEPEVWPSLLGAQAVLARFRKLSEMDQGRKMVNQESFMRQRIRKVEDQLRRLSKENKRREMENFMFGCIGGMATVEQFNLSDEAEMGLVVNQAIRDIIARKEALKRNEQRHRAAANPEPLVDYAPSPAPATVLPSPPAHPVEVEEPVLPFITEDADIDGFPWNLMQSPGANDFSLGFEDGGFAWDAGTVLPSPPYIFSRENNSNAPAFWTVNGGK